MATRLFCLMLTLAVVGCGGKGYEVATVSGVVTLDGAPLADASVVFAPQTEGPSSYGKTDNDGKYTLKTLTSNESGAMVAKHTVSITLTSDEEFDTSLDIAVVDAKRKIPRRYNSNSTLTQEIKAGANSDINFALTSEKDELDAATPNG